MQCPNCKSNNVEYINKASGLWSCIDCGSTNECETF